MKDSAHTPRTLPAMAGAAAVALLAVWLGCVGDPVSAPRTDVTAQVTIASARYLVTDTAVSVRLTWGEPAGEPGGVMRAYRVYRTSTLNRDGDPTGFLSAGAQRSVSHTARDFDDVIGLANAWYYYQVRVVVEKDGREILGPASNTAAVWVGSGVSFTINDGDAFVADTLCSLVVRDIEGQLASWRFTDSFIPVVDSRGVVVGREPVFSAAHHPANAPRQHTARQGESRRAFPWVLRQGGGAKYAFAELTWKNGSVTVVEDAITIAPYRIEVKMRNETRYPNETMLRHWGPDGREYIDAARRRFPSFTLVYPWVEFSVSIFNDSTFARGMEMFLVFRDSASQLSGSGTLLATPSLALQLTGDGPVHDDQHLYRYPFSPDSARYDPTSLSAYTLSAVTDMATGETVEDETPARVFRRMTALASGEILRGKKEFSVALVFRGRFFGEERVYYASPRLNPQRGTMVTYYDAYPPTVKLDQFENDYPEWGDTIRGSFTFSTNTQGSWERDGSGHRGVVEDGGGADIVSIDLVIAEMPDSLQHVVYTDSRGVDVLKELSLEQLTSLRHRTIPYPLATLAPVQYPVAWHDVDPSEWNSGWYIFAIVTEDRYGNRGIAPFNPNYVRNEKRGLGGRTNPTYYFLLTGNTEY